MNKYPQHINAGQGNVPNPILMPSQSRPANKVLIAIIVLSCILVVLLIIIGCLACSKQSAVEEPQEDFEIVEKPVEQTQNTVVPAPTKSAAMQATETQTAQLASQYGANVSVAVMPLDSNSLGFNINGGDRFVSASMIKLLILANYIQACDSGQVNGQAAYTVKSTDIVGGTGSIQGGGAGSTYTYDELAHYMIKCSDNTATNILIDTLGMSSINATASSLGLSQTQLNRKMMDTSSGVENYISANDAATILFKIGNKTLGSVAMCDKAIKYLLDQEDNLGISQGLNSGVGFAHKTGVIKNCRHDGGIVYSATPYIVVCLCDIGTSSGNSFMQQVGSVCASNLG